MQTDTIERAIVGAAIVSPSTIPAASVSPADFLEPRLCDLWTAILDLDRAGAPVDLVSLRSARPRIDAAFLASLTDGLPALSGAVVARWGDALRAARRAERLSVALAAASAAKDPQAQIRAAEEAIAAATRDDRGGAAIPLSTLSRSVVDSFERLADSKGAILGIKTGFGELDAMLAGLKPGDLVIVAGRPGMGKSSLASQIVMSSSARTLIVSLEMSATAIARRMIAAEAEVNQRAIQFGLREHQWRSLSSAIGAAKNRPVWIHESASTVGAIRSAARRLPGLELIVIDYLQLMEGEGRGVNRQEQVASISRGVKKLAAELGLPIIALSQLSRPADQRKDKRPQLTDLRESGALEQDADAVLLIHREDAHNPTEENRGKVDLIVAKQRDGDTGVVKLRWEKTFTKFYDDNPEPESAPTQESIL